MRERLRRANTRDDVLSLRVRKELAVETRLAGRGIARESDAGAGLVALVAEDHLHDVDRRAELVRNVIRAAVDLGARRVPRVEDGSYRTRELVARILRKVAIGLLPVDRPIGLDQPGQIVGGQIDVLCGTSCLLQIGECLFEPMAVDPVDDLAVHLDQPPVRVVGKALVPRCARKPHHRLVVQPEIEDRVHHPGHRHRRARPYGHEQRVSQVAEALAGLQLQCAEVLLDLLFHPVRQGLRVRHVRAAGVRRHE